MFNSTQAAIQRSSTEIRKMQVRNKKKYIKEPEPYACFNPYYNSR